MRTSTTTHRELRRVADVREIPFARARRTVDHDGLEIGCCECCSGIYYRHGGQWFTPSGAD